MQKTTFLFLCFLTPFWCQAQATWHKIKISKEGIYTLSRSTIKALKIDASPTQIHVFSGPSGVLPQLNKESLNTAMVEVPIFNNDKDNKWDKNDRISFYAEAANITKLTGNEVSYEHHPYDDLNYYYIKIDNTPQKKVRLVNTGNETRVLDLGLIWEQVQIDEKNMLGSGRKWFGPFFYDRYFFKKDVQPAVGKVKTTLSILGVGRQTQKLKITSDNSTIKEIALPASTYNPSDNYDRYNRYGNVSKTVFELNSLNFELSLATEGSANNGAYIDYIQYEYQSKLQSSNKNQYGYWLKVNEKALVKLTVKDENKNTVVWDALNGIVYEQAGLAAFETQKELQKIIITDTQAYLEIKEAEKINFNESAVVPQLLIVYAPAFKYEAEAYKAYKNRQLETAMISTDEIYDRYSSGKTDPTAIRDYCRFLWKKDQKKFKYLLLFGDASFDFKNIHGFLPKNKMVPSYQSKESLEPIYSYCSDDYYGFLEESEGNWAEGESVNNIWYNTSDETHNLDISIGRLPIKNNLEARDFLKKISIYQSELKKTKPVLTFVADNKDYSLHLDATEKLAAIAEKVLPTAEQKKVYIDQYKLSASNTAPEATAAMLKSINQGTYLINYAGHGSESGWAQEKLLTIKEMLELENTQWPIFFTATCQFGKFDNSAVLSGAELLLLKPNAGAIAFLTTTRPVYASSNEKINTAFFKLFPQAKTIGELYRLTKNASINAELNRNFTLLGDPSMPMPNWYENTAQLDNINGYRRSADTIIYEKGLRIEAKTSKFKSGKARILILNAPSKTANLQNSTEDLKIEYFTQNKYVYSAVTDVLDGKIRHEAALPIQDFISNYTLKIVFFNADSSMTDGLVYDMILKNKGQSSDQIGPKIEISTIDNSLLKIEATDPSGIFSGFGQSTFFNKLSIDDSIQIDLNEFASFTNQNQTLQAIKSMLSLSEGPHTLKVIVQDIYNNRSEKSFEIKTKKPELNIINQIIYPNPSRDIINVVFQHNRPSDHLNMNLRFFTSEGRKLKEVEKKCKNCSSTQEIGLEIDNKSVASNVLLYRLDLHSNTDGSKTSSSGRVLVLK